MEHFLTNFLNNILENNPKMLGGFCSLPLPNFSIKILILHFYRLQAFKILFYFQYLLPRLVSFMVSRSQQAQNEFEINSIKLCLTRWMKKGAITVLFFKWHIIYTHLRCVVGCYMRIYHNVRFKNPNGRKFALVGVMKWENLNDFLHSHCIFTLQGNIE